MTDHVHRARAARVFALASNGTARRALRGATVLLVLALAHPRVAQAQPPASTATPDVATPAAVDADKPSSGWAALPIGTYTPETSIGLGLFATHFFRVGDASPQTRPSSLSAVGLYTWRNQLITELIPELYWDDMRGHVWSRLDYRRYPNTLWAVGNRAPASSEEDYTEDRLRWQARFDQAVGGPLRFGAKLELVSMKLLDVERGGLIDTGAVPGTRAGRTFGLGPAVLWDTRDHLLVPRSGELLELAFMEYLPRLGSEHRYSEVSIDLRGYRSVFERHVLALQVYSQIQLGTAPFYDLPQLGGQNLLRGYLEGRYRDESLLALQAEYRVPLFWRLSGVAHAALGQVARGPLRLARHLPRWSVGPGLRAMLNTDEQLNLRVDLGIARESFGVYVGIAEAY